MPVTTYAPHQVGGVEITPLYDTAWQFVPRDFVPHADPREWLEVVGEPADALVRSRVLCFLLRSDSSTILVDCGVGSWDWWPYQPSQLLESLNAAGVAPSEIDVVAVTHLHPDHVGGAISAAPGRIAPTFPNARYVVSRLDWEAYVEPGSALEHTSAMVEAGLQTSARPLGELGVLELVEANHELTAEVRLMAAPGHTPGSVVVHVASGRRTALLIGDLAHHPAQLWRPGWGARNDFDPADAASSRATVMREALRLRALVGAAHFREDDPPLTTMEA